MSEARALTNFSGNAVATLLIGTWTDEIDHDRMEEVLSGRAPFDESDMLDEHYALDRTDVADDQVESSHGSGRTG